jgi:NhaA family Na+:H+ antiporter
VLLLTLAIADDIGAILVIAIGYSGDVQLSALLWAGLGVAVIRLLTRIGVRSLAVYCVLGGLVWLAVHESGIHATIAGVVLGLMTPARSYLGEGVFAEVLARATAVFQGGEWQTTEGRAAKVRRFQRLSRETIPPLEYLQNALHPWVSFVIMPVFALANAAVPIELSGMGDRVALAVAAALVVGKPVGIVLASWLAVRLGAARLPDDLSWPALAGGGALAGIGFTMSLFIAGQSFPVEGDFAAAKIAVFVASLVSAAIGVKVLWNAR